MKKARKRSGRGPNANLDVEEFVQVWQEAKDMAAVCKAFPAVLRGTLAVKAAGLRKNGVKLKKFPRGPSYDYAALAKLAERAKK